MSSTSRSTILGALLLVATVGPLAAQGQTPSFPIGFVNIEKVLEEHPGLKKALEEAEREKARGVESLRDREAQRRSRIESLDMVGRPGSKSDLEARRAIQILEKEIELDQDMIFVEYQFAIVKAMREAYDEIQKVVGQVAGDRKLVLVFNRSDHPLGGRSRFEFLDRLAMRDIAFAATSLDITEEVSRRIAAGGGQDGEEGR